ncbi:putative mannose-6-phosphate isomerase YvyI [compost metagenome]
MDRIKVNGSTRFTRSEPFTILSVIEGEGNIDGKEIKKGDHFILPFGYGEYSIQGNIELITSHM